MFDQGYNNNRAVRTQNLGSLSLTIEVTKKKKKLLTFYSNFKWKKPVLTTEFICLSNLSAESEVTPRFVMVICHGLSISGLKYKFTQKYKLSYTSTTNKILCLIKVSQEMRCPSISMV